MSIHNVACFQAVRMYPIVSERVRSLAIVPQLSKCLKFEAVWGVLN